MNTFEEKYLNKIQDLFEKYKGKMEDPELNKILKRNYVYSEVNSSAKILICGLNPSFRENQENEGGKDPFEPYGFNFHEVVEKDSFYKKRYDLLPIPLASKATYIDMLVQRHSNQKDLLKFCSTEKGKSFLAQQLEITKDVVEQLKPSLILVFNRFASNFWGLNPKIQADGKFTNIWLGYTFEDNNDGSFTIKKEMLKDSIGNKKETTLAGTKIYFSKHLDWRVRKEEYGQISSTVKDLISKYGK
ncbi:MAG: hypothetical protein A2W93_00430 [Bacteroidetes bacterium GWF2_43_63]|nr:MAG: hypothetical protein A2W94_13090 [Bacteroidetes bacterium GWE2_42_42]OFY53871.1 MAG: hypothetical protein A2W93_00430 [Bacteroidetes bacterium GWF2_43_63]HBG69830.1 hypothetical protein [Bacteroidales bacterium]HCB60973.1 hypothetical protein [Bacteroidales bacterium]HCY24529.1 hypothetical protein [Bacteroidales bacterium]